MLESPSVDATFLYDIFGLMIQQQQQQQQKKNSETMIATDSIVRSMSISSDETVNCEFTFHDIR